jgi:hypothetical protein
MDMLGKNVLGLSFPVCTSFQPTVLEGQLCYKLNVSRESGIGKANGILMVLDSGRLDSVQKEDTNSVKIYLNTLDRFQGNGAGKYAMSSLKRITVTENFMGLPEHVKKCQKETFEQCHAKKYVYRVQSQCGCIPWALRRAVTFEVR